MENQNPEKKQKKSTKSRFTGIVVCVICVYFIIAVILMVVLPGDPPKGEKGLHYRFSVENHEPVLTSGSEILIPAIVNGNNQPVFSESELVSHCGFSQSFRESVYPCNIRYTTLGEETMIALRPAGDPDTGYFSADFAWEEYEGDTFRLSPVIRYDPQFLLNLYTFPVYIRNSTFSGSEEIPIDNVRFGISVCGYNPLDPYVCKGFATRPDQRFGITHDLIPVVTNEYGEYNQYRYCFNPLIWPEIFLNPEKCW
jgi:hypothetical protein